MLPLSNGTPRAFSPNLGFRAFYVLRYFTSGWNVSSSLWLHNVAFKAFIGDKEELRSSTWVAIVDSIFDVTVPRRKQQFSLVAPDVSSWRARWCHDPATESSRRDKWVHLPFLWLSVILPCSQWVFWSDLWCTACNWVSVSGQLVYYVQEKPVFSLSSVCASVIILLPSHPVSAAAHCSSSHWHLLTGLRLVVCHSLNDKPSTWRFIPEGTPVRAAL